MLLPVIAFILLQALILAGYFFVQETKNKAFDIYLKMSTEVKQPFNPELLPKALTIEDLNKLARNYCTTAQAIVIQCIERHITNPSAPLTSFCRDVLNRIETGDDLTTNVQYLWGYLPNRIGKLQDIYFYPAQSYLLSANDLPKFVRYLFRRDISQTYQTYFWTENISEFYYHKPEDDRSPTPCAYSGVIIPP
jgi:predicted DNA-binding protein